MREKHVKYRLSSADSLGIRNTDEGAVGEWSMRSNRSLVTLATSPYTSNLVPSGCTLHAISMNVDDAVVDNGGDDTWDADLVGGVTGSLVATAPATADLKYDVQVTPEAGGRTRAREFGGVLGSQSYFTHANDAIFDWSAGDNSGILFCNPVLLGTNVCALCGVYDAVNSKREWAVVHTSDGLRLWATNDGSTLYYTSSTPIVLPTDEWSTVYFYKEAGVGIGIEVNGNGTISTGPMVPAIFSSDVAFRVGSVVAFVGTPGYWQGLIGELRLYDRLLTPAERLEFHEGGTPATEANNLIAKYMLDEYAGDAQDSVGAKHLTDTNTVTYGEGPGLTNVKFTPNGGDFTSGVIEVVAYYEQLTSMADA